MKVCIYSTPRSGSSSLFYYIQSLIQKNGLKSFFEPFSMHGNKNRKYESILNYENILIKSIIYQLPAPMPIEEFESNIVNDFDKIIILLRKDIKLQSESFTYRGSKHFMQQSSIKYGWGSWHTKAVYKFDDDEIDTINENEIYLLKNSEHLIKFANENNLFIIYLEDILDKTENYYKMLEYIGYSHIESLYDNVLSKKHKLRIEPVKKLL